jgi:hypothetical protein
VIDLMEALRQSVERNRAARGEGSAKKSTTKKADSSKRRQEGAVQENRGEKRLRQEEGAKKAAEHVPGGIRVYCVNMGIGIGIVLIVIGLIVLFALQGDVPFFTDGTLGII